MNPPTKFLLTAVLAFTCGCGGRVTAGRLKPTPGQTNEFHPVVIDLAQPIKSWRTAPELAFDKSSRLICGVWRPYEQRGKTGQEFHYQIFDENGQLQCHSDGLLNQHLVLEFPRLAAMALHPALIMTGQFTNRYLEDRRWDAAPDSTSLVRVRNGEGHSAVIELWKLSTPEVKQWEWKTSGKYSRPECEPRYEVLHGKNVIAVECGDKTVFLDAGAGTELDSISYENPQEVYIAGATCLIPQRGYFVCARYDSKRLRVISLAAPHRILREVGAQGSHLFGSWSTQHIECSSDGRFLLKESSYGSRLLPGSCDTMVFDTATWKTVWQVPHGFVLMSPDGKKLAIQEDTRLEIIKGPALLHR